MYFWDYKGLAVALRNNEVSDRQHLIYKVLFVIFAGSEFALIVNSVPGHLFSVALIYPLRLLIFFGIMRYINNKGDKKDLIKRWFSLFTPVFLRTSAIAILFNVILTIVQVFINEGKVPSENPALDEACSNLANFSALIYMLVIYIKAFRLAAGVVSYKIVVEKPETVK